MDRTDIERGLHKQVNRLLNLKNFDLEGFYYNFRRMISNLEKFHNSIGKSAKSPKELSAIQYDLPKSIRPKAGQVAYFYIEHSYPKEIYNSHWCLVLKDLGSIFIVIPLTSVKKDSNAINKEREIIIKIKDFEEEGCSKLKFNQMFSADAMRFDRDKPIYNLQTDFSYIKENLKKILDLY